MYRACRQRIACLFMSVIPMPIKIEDCRLISAAASRMSGKPDSSSDHIPLSKRKSTSEIRDFPPVPFAPKNATDSVNCLKPESVYCTTDIHAKHSDNSQILPAPTFVGGKF